MVDFALNLTWEILAILAAFASVLVAILVYMASKFFGSGQLETQAKGEMVFAASTLVLVLFVIGVLVVADGLAMEYINFVFFNGNLDSATLEHATVSDFVVFYIQNSKDCSVSFLNKMYIMDIYVQAVQSIIMEVMMSELATGFFMNIFTERITNLTSILTFYIIIYYVLFEILMFLKYFGMYFFTFGVVLRALPPTRGAGAFIMALCIGLYFVFPLSYVLMTNVFLEHYSSLGLGSLSVGSFVQFVSTGPTLAGECKIQSLQDFNLQLPSSTAGAFDITKAVFENSLNVKANENIFSDILDSAFAFLDMLTMQLCLLPFLAITVTLSFVLSSSALFGATIPEIGRGLVKLI
ncbi:MAG: hypothetical protein WC501_01590 [Candidatus Micrarchaeia archaeon]